MFMGRDIHKGKILKLRKTLKAAHFRDLWATLTGTTAKSQGAGFAGGPGAWEDPHPTILLLSEKTQMWRFPPPTPQRIAQRLVLISACDSCLAGTGPLLITEMQASAWIMAFLFLWVFSSYFSFF